MIAINIKKPDSNEPGFKYNFVFIYKIASNLEAN